MTKIRKLSPGRLIVLGFIAVILIGAILLALPFSAKAGVHVSPIDALFTSASAVCVTGLVTVDTADTYSTIGQAIIAILIQIGGLGVMSVGVALILLARRKVTFKERVLIKESLNLDSMRGIVKLVQSILLVTLCFEGVGTILGYLVFSREYSAGQALWVSLFHSVATFNNSGFDLLGGFRSLTAYRDNILLNLTTCGLIIFGGLGFFVIKDILQKRSFKRLTLHSKVVLTMTAILLAAGTILLKLAGDLSWFDAFFFSTSARTAGFATYDVGKLGTASLFIISMLMFIGASPGSTGGGIKTTTMFTLIKQAYSAVTNRNCAAYKRKIPADTISKAFMLLFLAGSLVCINTLLLCILEPDFSFIQIFFEVVSAFGTVGLSTGITPSLSAASKIALIFIMFIGRLGPLTMATIWFVRPESGVSYSEEAITIG